jgi:hypothetical protein
MAAIATAQEPKRGREQCRLARWKHGFSAKAAVAERRRMRALIAECGKLLTGAAGAAGGVP